MGEWIERYGEYYCSECGDWSLAVECFYYDSHGNEIPDYTPYRSRFCPHCGKEMSNHEED